MPLRSPLSRRAMLRGALRGSSLFVGLPLLEQMGRTGSLFSPASATGTEAPARFGVWFWGNGVRPDQWIPPTTGSGYALSEELAPLGALSSMVSVVSGCEIKTATHPHHSGMTGIMTGQAYYQLGVTRDTIVSTFARQSVDQDAADWISQDRPFRSVEAGVTWFRGTDEGSTFQHLSHNGPNLPNPSEYDPIALYQRLFGAPESLARDLVRQSVLDQVGDQIRHLSGRLGATDRLRLEQHLDSVRALEQRLGTDIACGSAVPPDSSFPDIDGREQIEQKNLVMSQLLAYALSCDLTRVFSLQFSTCGSGALFWQVGATDGMHGMTHFEAQPQPIVHAAVTFTMGMLAQFLQVLQDTPEGDSNLLQRCSILCSTELSDGSRHTNSEYPILIAGGGNGNLRPGQHIRTSGRNTSDAVLTALRGAGIPLDGWGVDAGYSASPVGELLV